MSPAYLHIQAPAALATVQDLGRFGFRRMGIPRSGTLYPHGLRLANALLGNPPDAAGIEFFLGGLRLEAQQHPIRLAWAGDMPVTLTHKDGQSHVLQGWRSLILQPGDSLFFGQLQHRRVGIIAVANLIVHRQLGSASTDLRAQLGGSSCALGRALRVGDRLAVTRQQKKFPTNMILGRYPHVDFKSPIRVVLGPQHHHFSEEALKNLITQPFTVTLEADRMGIRLSGPLLSYRPEYGADITSDATVPGSIQVPGNGQPIVLLADGQTVGGYAKIATVISADLPRLACAMPGQAIHFEIVDVPAAEKAARQAEADVLALINSITPLKTRLTPDTETLLGCNLISGMINALEKNHFNHVCTHD